MDFYLLRTTEDGRYQLPDWAYGNDDKLCINYKALADTIADLTSMKILFSNKKHIAYAYDSRIGIYEKKCSQQVKRIIYSMIECLITELTELRDMDLGRDKLCFLDVDITNIDGYIIRDTDVKAVYNALLCSTNVEEITSMNVFNANEDIIVFKNGVLNIRTGEFDEKFGAKYLSTIQIPVNYNPDCNKNPQVFLKFINHLANYDSNQRIALIEAIGLAISNVNVGQRCKKSIFMQGDGNCGKSIYLHLIEDLVGKENYAYMPFEKLNKQFAFSELYGKRIAADSDCMECNGTQISNFKLISSGDTVTAEYKYEPSFTFNFKGIYILATNKLPTFTGDKGDWVYDRMLLIQCGDTIPENERDKHLSKHLMEEAESIVFLAVTALRNLINRDYRFTVSAIEAEMKQEYKTDNNVYLSFLEEWCMPIGDLDVRSSDVVITGEAWTACKHYIDENYPNYTKSFKDFSNAIRAKYNIKSKDASKVISGSKAKNSKSKRIYPFTLKPEYLKYRNE